MAPVAPTLILVSGGLRSLVATAAAVAAEQHPPIILLHLKDRRPNLKTRAEHAHRQAKHFDLENPIEVDLPNLKQPEPITPEPRELPEHLPLHHAQTLTLGIAQAVALGADRLIWPVQPNADFPAVARLAEQITLAQHLAQLDLPQGTQPPAVDAPLLDLTDQQVLELGAQLNVPWDLAWSCLLRGENPCKVCDACRRRQAAFEAAGMIDPLLEHPLPTR
jgi:7-cyano-7-deazaguanine synthase